MQLKRLLVGVLACSVLVSAAVSPFLTIVCRGDVNGDQLVNVLDAQTMVAQVLGNTASAGDVDVNHDGRVDILDLQFVLAQVNGSASPEPSVPQDTKAPRAVVVAADRSWARVETSAVEMLLPKVEEMRASLRFHTEPVVVLSPHTERYLFTLTANAPPFLA